MELTKKEEFIKIYKENITKAGSENLLAWLEKSDFFTAPASTRFHGAYEGGLLEHSVNVYNCLWGIVQGYREQFPNITEETVAIAGLLHDVCKAQFYKKAFRNVKNEETGQWQSKQIYEVADQFPAGHGEKSVFLIQAFMPLSAELILAIRWHMSGYDAASRGGDYGISKAYETTPLAVMLSIADMEASYLIESRTSE